MLVESVLIVRQCVASCKVMYDYIVCFCLLQCALRVFLVVFVFIYKLLYKELVTVYHLLDFVCNKRKTEKNVKILHPRSWNRSSMNHTCATDTVKMNSLFHVLQRLLKKNKKKNIFQDCYTVLLFGQALAGPGTI